MQYFNRIIKIHYIICIPFSLKKKKKKRWWNASAPTPCPPAVGMAGDPILFSRRMETGRTRRDQGLLFMSFLLSAALPIWCM